MIFSAHSLLTDLTPELELEVLDALKERLARASADAATETRTLVGILARNPSASSSCLEELFGLLSAHLPQTWVARPLAEVAANAHLTRTAQVASYELGLQHGRASFLHKGLASNPSLTPGLQVKLAGPVLRQTGVFHAAELASNPGLRGRALASFTGRLWERACTYLAANERLTPDQQRDVFEASKHAPLGVLEDLARNPSLDPAVRDLLLKAAIKDRRTGVISNLATSGHLERRHLVKLFKRSNRFVGVAALAGDVPHDLQEEALASLGAGEVFARMGLARDGSAPAVLSKLLADPRSHGNLVSNPNVPQADRHRLLKDGGPRLYEDLEARKAVVPVQDWMPAGFALRQDPAHVIMRVKEEESDPETFDRLLPEWNGDLASLLAASRTLGR